MSKIFFLRFFEKFSIFSKFFFWSIFTFHHLLLLFDLWYNSLNQMLKIKLHLRFLLDCQFYLKFRVSKVWTSHVFCAGGCHPWCWGLMLLELGGGWACRWGLIFLGGGWHPLPLGTMVTTFHQISWNFEKT